jgi:hypothetical protein
MALTTMTAEARMQSPSGLSSQEENAYVIELLRSIDDRLRGIAWSLHFIVALGIWWWWVR